MIQHLRRAMMIRVLAWEVAISCVCVCVRVCVYVCVCACVYVCVPVCGMCILVTELHPTLWDPTDCCPSDSSAHGILQARILEWRAILFLRGSS